MATKVMYETKCDVCGKIGIATEEKTFGNVEVHIHNIPLTAAQADFVSARGGQVEQWEHTDVFFGAFHRTAEVCGVSCARRLLILLTNSLPPTLPNDTPAPPDSESQDSTSR